MSTRHNLPRRTDPSIQADHDGWLANESASSPWTHPASMRFGHEGGYKRKRALWNSMLILVFTLLLTLLIHDRQAQLRALFSGTPGIPLTTPASVQQPTNEVVMQEYERLAREIDYEKSVINNARNGIEQMNQTLQRYQLELSANQAALAKLKSEYAVPVEEE